MLTVGSLFAGIGGFDLGLERAGMKVIWQSEIDPYASTVLKKHWPSVPNLGDIRGITAATVAHSQRERLEKSQLLNPDLLERSSNAAGQKESPITDVLCGGFPCQDISNAGKRAGIDGERSGLWSEYARVIGELRPRYVIVENVAALLGRGLERVLGDLAALGFDAEWHCIPASAVGAPHRRDRLWIVAWDANGINDREKRGVRGGEVAITGRVCADVAHAERIGRQGPGKPFNSSDCTTRIQREAINAFYGSGQQQWRTEPNVGRVANGVPSRVDRLRCLGNAIVPQIAEIIGRAIVITDAARAKVKP